MFNLFQQKTATLKTGGIMRTDGYDKIIEVSEIAMNQMSKCKNYEELAGTTMAVLNMIIGICVGAKSAEKVGE